MTTETSSSPVHHPFLAPIATRVRTGVPGYHRPTDLMSPIPAIIRLSDREIFSGR